MPHRAYSLALTLLIAPLASAAAAPPAAVPALREWIAIAPFAAGGKEMSCANHGAGGEWSVVASDSAGTAGSAIQVRPFVESPELSARLKVADGSLVAFDRGEWGGGLSWFSAGGATHYSIISTNVRAVVAHGGNAVAFGGLDHLGPSQGQVFELAAPGKDGRWQVTRTLDLGAAPSVVAADPRGGFLVVTSNGLSRYAKGRVEQLHAAPYSSLFPNSMTVAPDGTVYIGMRHAVARLTPKGIPQGKGYTEIWLVQPACRGLTIVEGPRLTCTCRG